MEWTRDILRLTDSLDDVDRDRLRELLEADGHWAADRGWESTLKSLEHSVVFNLYDGSKYIGFARVVTDYAVTSHLADLIIDPIVHHVLSHPHLIETGLVPATQTAASLYERAGFFVTAQTTSQGWEIEARLSWAMAPI